MFKREGADVVQTPLAALVAIGGTAPGIHGVMAPSNPRLQRTALGAAAERPCR